MEHQHAGKRRLAGGSLLKSISLVFALMALMFVLGFLSATISENEAAGTLATGSRMVQEAAGSSLEALKSLTGGQTHLYLPVRKCDDSCPRAKNGICDEGRPANAMRQIEVFCDLGTDCSDCGTWEGSPYPGSGKESAPIKILTQELALPMYTRLTLTTPTFQVLYTDPAFDLDVSEGLNRTGWLEAGITSIFRNILTDNCIDKATGKRRLVLDVGANFGYFSAYAALFGCRVIAWEPVPHFRAVLGYTLAVNNLTHLVEVRGKLLSEKDGEVVKMQAPTRGVWGTASVAGIAQIESQKPTEVSVISERIDSVVAEDVLLMKMDVEGFESVVMKSAVRLFTKHNVENVVFEYSPGAAEKAVQKNPMWSHLVTGNPRMVLDLLNQGYKIGMMHDHISKGGHFPLNEFPALPEVTAARMAHDIKDAEDWLLISKEIKMGKVTTGSVCPYTRNTDLTQYNVDWNGCTLPECGHPKSLRSSFPYNTNLWASRGHKNLKFDGLAGAMGPKQSAKTDWFVKFAPGQFAFAMASRSCQHVPAAQMVRNRCSCDFSVAQGHKPEEIAKCRAEEKIINKMMAEGIFKFEDNEVP